MELSGSTHCLFYFLIDIYLRYPGRDARIDDQLGAKRIEWHREVVVKNHNVANAWNPVTDVESDAITCRQSFSAGSLAC